jgi:ADP-ribosylglycohydrolase
MYPKIQTLVMKKPLLLLAILFAVSVHAAAQPSLADRVEGLLVGSLIGDAAGVPDEFQKPDRSVWTSSDTVLDARGRSELAERFRLKAYKRDPGPYAHWVRNAPAGTFTDDSRFKILFFNSLEEAGRPTRSAFARALLEYHADTTGPYGTLPREWLDEFAHSARWVLGFSEREGALPPERAWGGIPTMAGQMPFLPISAFFPRDPEAAYRLMRDVDILDNGVGRDLNAALVAGLAAALGPKATWLSVEMAMRGTDPFAFGEVPWVRRELDVWLDVAYDAVQEADGRAKRLFEILERDLRATTWWDAWIPMTVVFACAEFTAYDPLATMQLILEFGYDTDSYMQVAGAFFGALHGKQVFPVAIRETVERRLREDFGDEIGRWKRLLGYSDDVRQVEPRRYRPRVLITTDVNNAGGDPDDKQSLAHVLWFANELEIAGVIPDYWNGRGVEATLEVLEAYASDYTDPSTRLEEFGYPSPARIRSLVQRDPESARRHLIREAHKSSGTDPLYVLVWGQMHTLSDALAADPTIAPKVRILTIGTNIKSPRDGSCTDRNWNSGARSRVFDDARFNKLWWLESDWTYAGMFDGPEPARMLDSLAQFGALGAHVARVVEGVDRAQYFRAGDTPTVLYLVDPSNNLDDPSHGSWAGRFTRPFPDTRPFYWTGTSGASVWDYSYPCRTWDRAEAVYSARKQTLLDRRPEMYESLLARLRRLYRSDY